MANSYDVEVVNPLQALLLGQQSYASGIDSAKKRAKEQAIGEASQLAASGDRAGALAKLLGVGDYQGAGLMNTMDQQNWNRQHTTARDAIGDKRWSAEHALRQAQFAENQDYTPEELDARRVAQLRAAGVDLTSPEARTFRLSGSYADPNLPKVLSPGSMIARPGSGEVILKNGGDALLDEDTIRAMAEQYRAGDTSVLQNLGRGAQGAENIVKLRQEVVRQNKEAGVSGAEQALRNAEMFGVKASQRSIGTKGANIEMAATEFNQVIPVVQAASRAVSRTNYPDLNKIILAGQERTGDPNVVRFGGGVNTLVNLYARAISPTGVATVSDKDHAREILNKAWSTGQFDAAVGMMQQEIEAALRSPEKVRDEMRTRFLKGQGAAPVGYPAPGHSQSQNDPLGIR